MLSCTAPPPASYVDPQSIHRLNTLSPLRAAAVTYVSVSSLAAYAGRQGSHKAFALQKLCGKRRHRAEGRTFHFIERRGGLRRMPTKARLLHGIPLSNADIPHYRLLPCVRGEQVLSWQRHGVALTTCELGNGALCAPFPDRSAVSTAREAVAASAACCGGMSEGVKIRN